jgi:hypothetical protein
MVRFHLSIDAKYCLPTDLQSLESTAWFLKIPFLFSGGAIQYKSIQIPQAPTWTGRSWGKGRHCRVPGQQTASEEPRSSHKSHKWRMINSWCYVMTEERHKMWSLWSFLSVILPILPYCKGNKEYRVLCKQHP